MWDEFYSIITAETLWLRFYLEGFIADFYDFDGDKKWFCWEGGCCNTGLCWVYMWSVSISRFFFIAAITIARSHDAILLCIVFFG